MWRPSSRPVRCHGAGASTHPMPPCLQCGHSPVLTSASAPASPGPLSPPCLTDSAPAASLPAEWRPRHLLQFSLSQLDPSNCLGIRASPTHTPDLPYTQGMLQHCGRGQDRGVHAVAAEAGNLVAGEQAWTYPDPDLPDLVPDPEPALVPGSFICILKPGLCFLNLIPVSDPHSKPNHHPWAQIHPCFSNST